MFVMSALIGIFVDSEQHMTVIDEGFLELKRVDVSRGFE